jgi:phosphoenolpyruvate carboxykinase (ATP)
MFEEFAQTAKYVFEDAQRDGRMRRNPDEARLRTLALDEPEVRETKFGSLMALSEPTSRSAALTKNNVDTQFGKDEYDLLDQARKSLATQRVISMDVEVGDGTEGVTARLIVPEAFAHVAYAGRKLFKPTTTEDPTHQVVMFFDDEFEKNKKLPNSKKAIVIRCAHSPEGKLVKIVRNCNYFGEWKKGVFTGEDFRAKRKGDAIFLHAGARMDVLEGMHGSYETTYSLFVALSANGKTSTTCKVLARKGRERSWLIQDDGGTLCRDGRFLGFEPGGLFVKTDALNPHDQIESYYGAMKPGTFLENVWVDDDGSVDFYNVEITSNGRAVIERRDFMHARASINTERVDNLFLITRGNIIPAIAKLTPEQAAAFMVLGQSMESSAGDATRAGQIKNEFFYDPFVAGDRSDHANLFYDLLKANPHINCYLLNTGGIGDGATYHDINLGDTMGILDSVIRKGFGENDWIKDEKVGLPVPRAIRTVDSILVHPEKTFSKAVFAELQGSLDKQRAQELDKYPRLEKRIRQVFQKA